MAGIEIIVETNARDARGFLSNVRRRQLPFATAKALTLTAREVARDSGARMGDYFKIRAKGLPKAAFTFQRAEKRDWPHPRAVVHLRERFEFMADHAIGVDRRPEKGASRMAVPTSLVQRTRSGRVRKAHKPRALRAGKAQVVEVNGTDAIKVQPGPRAKLRAGIFYTLHPKTRIRRTWRVGDDAADSMLRHYGPIYTRVLGEAIRDRRG